MISDTYALFCFRFNLELSLDLFYLVNIWLATLHKNYCRKS